MHLNSEAALDLIDGRATEAQAANWSAHIETCVECNRQLDAWKQMRSLLATPHHLENAPAEVLRMANAIHVGPDKRTTVREIFASLVFDSFAQPVFAGARGAAGARQFLFSAEEFDIHVKVWGPAPIRRMAGQILSRGEQKHMVEGTKLHLLRNQEQLETTQADWFGEFEFDKVPEGMLNLRIELPLLTITGAVNIG
jgi:anti-sigma factor RsiW